MVTISVGLNLMTGADVAALYKSALVTSHVLGLVLGLGTATIVDLILVRFLINGKVTGEHWAIISFLSKLVGVGLFLLCISGFGFLHHHSVFDPEKLDNPKLVAKLALALILILNGAFIHRFALPLIRCRIGQPLFEGMPRREHSALLVSGALSATSWYSALVLGTVSQFNFGPSASAILFGYSLVFAGAIVATHLIAIVWVPPGHPVHPHGTRVDTSDPRVARFVTERRLSSS